MSAAALWTILGGLALAGLLAAEARGSRRGVWIAKPAASVAFLAVAVAAGASGSAYGGWLVLALALSLAGDVLLIPPGRMAFLAGLGAFLLAHLAFLGAFLARGADLPALLLAAAAAAGPGWAVLAWLRPHLPAGMLPPVAAYVAAITLMVAASWATFAARGGWIVPGAAVAFWLSDVSVARDQFVAPGPANRLWGLPLYYAAQFAFAWSVV